MNTSLTEKQQKIYSFIVDFFNNKNFMPTIRELAENFSISVSTASGHVAALVKKNYLLKSNDKSHTFFISKVEKKIKFIPFLNDISTEPIEAQIKKCYTYIEYPIFIKDADKIFFSIKIDKTNLQKSGIYKNDIAILILSNTPKNGDIILTKLIDENDFFLKYYSKEHNRFGLKNSEDDTQIQYYQNITCFGILKHIMRNYE